jgi:integrase
VFTTQLGTAIDPPNVNRWLADLCDRAGVRSIRPYDLRHTCASLLLAQGVPARVFRSPGHRPASTPDVR